MARSIRQIVRARRRVGKLYQSAGLTNRLRRWLGERSSIFVRILQLTATAAAVAHLIMVGLVPEGRNDFYQIDAPRPFTYLSLIPVGDTVGYPETSLERRFLLYRAYTQDGSIDSRMVPDLDSLHGLRYDRWARAVRVAGQDYPELHRSVVEYLLLQLPSPPLKLELFSARWHPLRQPRPVLGKGTPAGPPGVALRLLGTYDGLQEVWHPSNRSKGG